MNIYSKCNYTYSSNLTIEPLFASFCFYLILKRKGGEWDDMQGTVHNPKVEICCKASQWHFENKLHRKREFVYPKLALSINLVLNTFF